MINVNMDNARPGQKIELWGVEGCAAAELERALKAKKLYFAVGRRWVSGGGGYSEAASIISTRRPRPTVPRAIVSDAPSNGPTDSALTRAFGFNAGREPGSNSMFITDPRVTEVLEVLYSLGRLAPDCDRPRRVFVWHRATGAIFECGRGSARPHSSAA